jgi:hypothetical protein
MRDRSCVIVELMRLFWALSKSRRTRHSFIYLHLAAPGTSAFRLVSNERKSWRPQCLLLR